MSHIAENIDKISNDVLKNVILNPNNHNWKFFAIKVILTRLNLKMKMNAGNEAIMLECCNELRDLLRKSSNVPNSQSDLEIIISLG